MDPIIEIINYVRHTRYDDLPQEVVEVIKTAFIDTVGANIAGSSAPLGKLVAEIVKDCGGKKESSILVYGYKVPQSEAAFANATMSRCRELDDVHQGNSQRGGGFAGHFNVTIIPAALAMLECSPKPISGRQLILGIAIGGDIVARLRLAAGESGRVGWMAETVAPFGVVATAAKLLDLSEEVIANAMGAAYAFCSGNVLSVSDGSWDIWLAAGIGARAGVMAVNLAQRGYLGAKSPLTGAAGLYRLYFRNEYHEKLLLSDLGREFESANVSIKPYSCCAATHHAIYTALELINKHNIRSEQIERITVRTCAHNMWLVVLNEKGEHKHAPRTLAEAQFSMPFTVATAIIKGTVFPDVLTEETLRDVDILRLSRKITVESTHDKNEIMKKEGVPPDDVYIYTTDGKIYFGCEAFVKGHPQNRMSFAECADKFRRCAKLSAQLVTEQSLNKFLEQAENIEKIDDVRGMISDLS